VVEDDLDQARVLAEILGEAGLETDLASGAEEALARLRAAVPDLIVLDIRLAGRSGMSLYREIKLSKMGMSETPVIFVSGVSMAQDFQGARFSRLMGDDQVPPPECFIEKPIRPERLLEAIRTVLGRSALRASGGEG
jgi:CheY-like chemotaxis protein